MDPEQTNNNSNPITPGGQGPVVGGAPQSQLTNSQQAAANVIRNQINNLYDIQDTSDPNTKPKPTGSRVEYDRHHEPQLAQWKKYHSAWQDYYQKYYQSYYAHQFKVAQTQQPVVSAPQPTESESKEEALFDLHQRLMGKVQESAKKVKKSRHFIPIISGLLVVLLFLFLQYNRVLIANVSAYVSPGSIDPQNIVIDPSTNVKVSSEPRLIIPKINVDVPVIYDVGNDYDSQMAAMVNGVAHFAVPGASSHPGQVGNTVLAGHSSNDLFDSGNYKFIFAQLDKLTVGDTIYVNYKSTRYTYTVTKKQVVAPSEIDKLTFKTTKPILTLLTCTPLGTSINRLLVFADQISPDPNKSTSAPKSSDQPTSESIPGNSPTLLERLFGAH
jgi:sortase A